MILQQHSLRDPLERAAPSLEKLILILVSLTGYAELVMSIVFMYNWLPMFLVVNIAGQYFLLLISVLFSGCFTKRNLKIIGLCLLFYPFIASINRKFLNQNALTALTLIIWRCCAIPVGMLYFYLTYGESNAGLVPLLLSMLSVFCYRVGHLLTDHIKNWI